MASYISSGVATAAPASILAPAIVPGSASTATAAPHQAASIPTLSVASSSTQLPNLNSTQTTTPTSTVKVLAPVIPQYSPPIQFETLFPNMFRSGVITPANLSFLQMLSLRTIIDVSMTNLHGTIISWCQHNGIDIVNGCNVSFPVDCTQDKLFHNSVSCVNTKVDIDRCVSILMSQSHSPVLIMSDGRRDSVVVGCLLARMGISASARVEHYRRRGQRVTQSDEMAMLRASDDEYRSKYESHNTFIQQWFRQRELNRSWYNSKTMPHSNTFSTEVLEDLRLANQFGYLFDDEDHYYVSRNVTFDPKLSLCEEEED